MYSRLAYAAFKFETSEGVMVKPDVFFPIVSQDIVTEYGSNPSMPIIGSRVANINAIKNLIPSPEGTLGLQIEPKTMGYFLKAVFGAITSGRMFPIELRLAAGSTTGTPAVGATLSQASTGATAVVTALVSGNAYYVVRSVTVGFNASNLVTGTNPDGTTFTFTPSATLPVPNWTVGETVTGGTSSATAVILAVSSENDYLLMGAPTGTFTAAGEAITGGTSSTKSNLLVNASTVYGHEAKAPQNTLPTMTLEIGLDDVASRFGGVRLNALSPIAQSDNIMTAEVAVTALNAFRLAEVTEALAAGSGSKTIKVDQTTGLVATDTIKVFRPSTGAFLDFSASSVKTHAVGAVVNETSFTVTNVETALAVGDLIVLAPQTPSYSLAREFSWIGSSVVRAASSIVAAIAATPAGIEDYTLQIMNEIEGRHGANGTDLVNRFPIKNHLKAFKGEGTIKKAYLDQSFLARMRKATQTAWHFNHIGDQIASTGLYYRLDLRVPNTVLRPHNLSFDQDSIVDEEIEFDLYRDATAGFTAKALLVNEVTSY